MIPQGEYPDLKVSSPRAFLITLKRDFTWFYLQLMTQFTNQNNIFCTLASCPVDRFFISLHPQAVTKWSFVTDHFLMQVPISRSHWSPSSLFTGVGQCSAMHLNLKLMKRKKSETILSHSYWSLSLSDSSSSTEDTTLQIFSVMFL